MYDIQKIREDFPILDREVYGKPLIYLDNGAAEVLPDWRICRLSGEALLRAAGR